MPQSHHQYGTPQEKFRMRTGPRRYGSIGMAFMSGVLAAIAVRAIHLALDSSSPGFLENLWFRPWPWDSPLSIACLLSAAIFGLATALYLARSQEREDEHDRLTRRLGSLDEQISHDLTEANKRIRKSDAI
jgi:Zn-dependent protease with chaperone function